ncbi:MAG: hypothetical protein M1365_16765 [Actinobacteria bacterium]|nr:hypothetical protein [Actinomycetota bacterium]
MVFTWLLITKRLGLRIVKPVVLNYLTILFIFLLTIVLIGWVLTNPAYGFDGWAIWSFKAKIFYLRETIPLDFLKQPDFFIFINSNYVILLPLIQAWIYLHLGHMQTSYAQVIYIITYASMLLISLDFFKSVSKNKTIPGALVLMLALMPWLVENSQKNYADIILAVYLVSGFAFLIHWLKGESNYYLWFSSLLFGFGAFTKNEGIIIYIIFIIFMCFHLLYLQKKPFFSTLRQTSKPILISSIVWLVWTLFSKFNNLNTIMTSTNLTIDYTLSHYKMRLFVIFKAIINETVLRYTHWGLTWPLFIFLFIVALFAGVKTVKYYLFIFIIIAVYIAIYFYTPLNLQQQLNTSLDRLVLQITPCAILLSGYTLLKLWDKISSVKQK